MTDALYVYGVVSEAGASQSELTGIDGKKVEPVAHDGLVALTSRLEHDTLTARDIRAHWRVLEQVFEHTTVLPMRFGTVLEGEQAVREFLLEPNAEHLSTLLADMEGLVQLNVKARYVEEPLLREVVRVSPALAKARKRLDRRPGGGTPAEQIALGQLVESEIGRVRVADTDVALRILAPLAVAIREEKADHPAAFSLACLVERGREPELSKGVAAVREELGDRVEIRYVGPLPPFSFAESDLTHGSAAWA
jgi:Gas vesicle synthesis protein GvpL/GvpF